MKLVEIAFFVEDVMATAGFYRALLAAEPIASGQGMEILQSGETKIFIHQQYTPAAGDLPPENHLAFEVADVDAACEQLAAAGVSVERPPQAYYWGRSAYLRAPNGQLIELIQVAE